MELQPGQVVRVRTRRYLVEEVVPPPKQGDDTLVRLACVDDDALGAPLEVLWEREIDAEVRGEPRWAQVSTRGFDHPGRFASYLNVLRWNCVTATDPRLLQAPYRAGIEVLPYQVEPLRKALLLPRVNLFIADDVGLGKTIEAGLIARELLMRQKVRRIVVAAPPSVVLQWRDELEARFGLPMVVFNRDYVLRCRRERGYGVNPWTTHSRFVISHSLLRDEDYAAPLRDWLGKEEPSPGTLLILDEAHHAAPASGARYAIDSRFTRVIRELAPRFEHRLFLSATPHNGHSNSFSALLEILDPQRFCRGVKVRSAKQLDAVMVRRLKSDLREVSSGIPTRRVIQIDLDGLPAEQPELKLAELLEEYAEARELDLAGRSKSAAAAAKLVLTNLQKRLLSSVEAFAFTWRMHRRALEKKPTKAPTVLPQLDLIASAPGADDEAGDLSPEELTAAEQAQIELASEVEGAQAQRAFSDTEKQIVEDITKLAEATRNLPDARVAKLVTWLRENCQDKRGAWTDRRVLIFTEYQDTERYLLQRLRETFPDRADERIQGFHGGIGDERREELKRAFNAEPADHPLRVLVATDAAREGVNLQNHCADLFHFDVPWNPSRMEQRNGRIDRKLQRSPEVRCHYFVYKQRAADHVLEVLVEKSKTIQKQLGSLSPVLETKLLKALSGGIRARDVDTLRDEIRGVDEDSPRELIEEELEAAREREAALAKQIAENEKLLEQSRKHLRLSEEHLHRALDDGLGILRAPALKQVGRDAKHRDTWRFPDLVEHDGADASWADTLDTLRRPRQPGEKLWDWRREAPVRPVMFHDVGSLDESMVHLHLEHRVVQRLLGRFLAQGFVHDDIARATVLRTESAMPRVMLLGRLALHGPHAARLHDEIVAVAAHWQPSSARKKLELFNVGETEEAMQLLEAALSTNAELSPSAKQVLPHAERDVTDLLPELKKRAESLGARAERMLAQRAEKEAKEMVELLESQRKRIEEALAKEDPQLELFDLDARRQVESEKKHQRKRLEDLKRELESEPSRIRQAYEVKLRRVEPIGLVYLMPRAG